MPEWMELVQPGKHILESDITFDDGGPDHDWTQSNRDYPVSFDKNWLETVDIDNTRRMHLPKETFLSLNRGQRFAFSLVLETLLNHHQKRQFQPLRLIVTGTAGSGNRF